MGIRKIPSDTRYFKFHNANPFNKRTCDCVVRAVSTALGEPYEFIVHDMVGFGLEIGLDNHDPKLIGKYLESRGWTKQSQPKKADGRKFTGEEFCRYLSEHYKSGSLVANIGGHHTVAILRDEIGFRVYDTWNSTDGCIGNYWI